MVGCLAGRRSAQLLACDATGNILTRVGLGLGVALCRLAWRPVIAFPTRLENTRLATAPEGLEWHLGLPRANDTRAGGTLRSGRCWRAGLLSVILLLVSRFALAEDASLTPDPNLTPGAILPVTAAEVCRPGYAKSVRRVDSKTKALVYHEYGIEHHGSAAYEIDHLISLSLGGSNDIRNLWPESLNTHPWNGHAKDRLEDRLHKLVCKGALGLDEAQAAIASNWIAAYRKYIEER